MEVTVAGGAAGSGLAGLTVWQTEGGKAVWAALSAAFIIVAFLKPFLKLSDSIEAYGKLYGEYTTTYTRMKLIVDELQVDKELTDARVTSFKELRARLRTGCAREAKPILDPSPKDCGAGKQRISY